MQGCVQVDPSKKGGGDGGGDCERRGEGKRMATPGRPHVLCVSYEAISISNL